MQERAEYTVDTENELYKKHENIHQLIDFAEMKNRYQSKKEKLHTVDASKAPKADKNVKQKPSEKDKSPQMSSNED